MDKNINLLRKYFLITILIVLILPSTYAALSKNPLTYLDFENITYGSTFNNSWAKSYTTTQYNGSMFRLINTTGKIGNALRWNTSTALTPFMSLGDWTGFDNRHNFTVSFWLKTALVANEERLIVKSYDFYSYRIRTFALQTTLTGDTGNGGSLTGSVGSVSSFNDGNWHFWTYVKNDTHLLWYVDGALDRTNTSTGAIADTSDYLCIGAECRSPATTGSHFDGVFDEIGLFDYALSSSEISYLYNGGSGLNPFSVNVTSVSNNINISETEPTSGQLFGTATINLNASVNSTYDFNVSLYINSTLNETKYFNAGSNRFVNFTTSFPTGYYSYYLYAVQANDTTQNETSTIITFSVDTVNPVLTTNFINNSLYYNNNLVGYINLYDNDLIHSYNITIDDASIYSNESYNQQTKNITLNYNVSNLSIGQHTLKIRVADGHTEDELLDGEAYKDSKCLLGDCLKYEFVAPYEYGQVKISQKDGSIFDNWETEQLVDRYKFYFEPNVPKESYTFTVETSSKYDIVENDKYGQWIVYQEHWLDFAPYKPSIRRISDTIAEITISGVDSNKDVLEFNSIGDLNIVETTYLFYTLNATMTYTSPVIESETQTITLSLDKTLNMTTSAALYYNGNYTTALYTNYPAYDYYSATFSTPEITNDTENKNMYWVFNISYLNTSTYNISGTQLVYKINIADCESNASWAKALTFVSKDEETDANLTNLTLNIDFTVTFTSTGIERNFSFGFKPLKGNHSICIFPNTTTYYVDAIMEYYDDSSLYTHRKYYLNNYTLDNTTDTIYLYNLLITKASAVILKVYDVSSGEAISDSYVKILRYYPNYGNYKTVEIERTDSVGKTLGKMVLYDVFYKFIVEKDNEVILDSSVEKVITTTKLLPVLLNEDVLESYKKINDVTGFVSCTNLTKICRFTWSDSQNIVQTATLNVYRVNGYGRTLISSQSTSSVAGTMTYTITEATDGNRYIAEGMIETNTEFSNYMFDLAELAYQTSFRNWGGLSILFPIILLMISVTFAFIGVGAIGVIASSLLVLIVCILLGWLPLALSTIISLVIIGGLLIAKIKQ